MTFAAPPVDLLLLHPPSVYDFRDQAILYGPVSDMVPSSVVFELYPVGFLTMAGYLGDRGLAVRIVNLALRMMTNRRFDVRKFLAAQRPAAVGIDLHWLPHAHGALEVARLVKELHPDVPVIMGGLSASYYHDELAARPEVDYVLSGDSTEQPLHELLVALREGRPVDGIANLSWKDGGRVRTNPLSYIPPNLDDADVRPELLVEMAVRYRDVSGVLPFNGWLANPTTMVLPLKGCAWDCVTCGSSKSTCIHLTGRRQPAFLSPARLVESVQAIGRFSRGPVVIPGDLLQGGEAYATAVLDGLAAARVDNEICFEFFHLPPRGYLARIDRSLPNWSFEISPESHDPDVRGALDGKCGYDNAAFESFLREALALDCHRIDVFFMIGLPRQTYDSVMQTVAYCGQLMNMGDPRLCAFISPMGPFLDPGSRIFEAPERYGYRLFARTLEEHRQLLVQPSWEQILNYETEWMSRAELVDATYDAAERLNALKCEHGRIPRRRAQAVAAGIAEARRLRARLATGAVPDVALRGEINRYSASTVCDKRELFWQRHLFNFRFDAILRAALSGRRRGATAPSAASV